MSEHFGAEWQSFTANTQQGDYFVAGRIGAKLAIDASCLVGGGISLTKTAATVSSKSAKAGLTRASRLGMQTIDVAADGMVNAVKTTAPASESMLTFQYKLQQQQQRTANLAVQGTKVDVVLPNTAGRRAAQRELSRELSFSKPRVDTSKLPNTSSSLSSSSSINTKVHIPDDKVGHIFRNSDGHIPDIPENRKLLIDIAQDLATRQGIDQHGTAWHSQLKNDGSQVWIQVRGNKIINGGINNPPRAWHDKTGYSAPNKPTKGPQNK